MHAEPEHVMANFVQENRESERARWIRRFDRAILATVAIDAQDRNSRKRIAPTLHAQWMPREHFKNDRIESPL